MSRGAGRIERAIREVFDTHPDLAFITDELAEHCYPDATTIERKHQVSVLRSAHKVAAADPDWEAWRIYGMGRGWVFVNHANVQSYTLGRMIAEDYKIYRSEKRLRRAPGTWVRKAPGVRVKVLDSLHEFVADRAELLALPETRRHLAEGTWAELVAEHIAYRDSDAATRAAMDTQREADRQAWLAMGAALGRRLRGESQPGDKELLPRRSNTFTQLADHVRGLLTQNDPDAVRDGLREVADALDALSQ